MTALCDFVALVLLTIGAHVKAQSSGAATITHKGLIRVESDRHAPVPRATRPHGTSSMVSLQSYDFHLFFTTDCSAHQRWMALSVFTSAQRVGQTEPITWVRSGCKSNDDSKDGDLVKSLYPSARLAEVRVSSANGADHNFNMGFGVPKGVASYLEATQDVANTTVLALIEADMVFLSRLRLDDLETHGLPMPNQNFTKHGEALIGGKVAIAQHYQCCDNLGPPYILSMQGWRELAPIWGKMTAKGQGWGADQEAFAEAARKAEIKFNVFEHFMVSDRAVTGEAWPLVTEALKVPSGDVCSSKLVGVHPGVERLPTFMHIVRPWVVNTETQQAWGFSKYQVPPGWNVPQKTDGILECGMPLFAEPPENLLQTLPEKDRESGWAICTIIHSLNSMLWQYKSSHCTDGFNTARALKMNVPLEWTNSLLDGAVEQAPKGTDIEWMKKCAKVPMC